MTSDSRPTPPHPAAARSYDGEGITVSFDAHRCLHAAECVRGLPADEVADVIHRCPSGALQYHRTDGLPDEIPDVPTHVSLHPDGVLHLRGDLEVATPHGPHHETRAMLCGCGATGNTPYCDHSGACAGHDQGAGNS
ncbi:hypothetical protein ACH439_16870 [Streptomyces microflavus]|uniref:hypothetical protein n=1 Tax=Streptomyces microflavus TaxID=1919 RepID=UPI0037AA4E70